MKYVLLQGEQIPLCYDYARHAKHVLEEAYDVYNRVYTMNIQNNDVHGQRLCLLRMHYIAIEIAYRDKGHGILP